MWSRSLEQINLMNQSNFNISSENKTHVKQAKQHTVQ